MTLVEFIAPVKDGKHENRVLVVLYFKERYDSSGPLTVEKIRTGLKTARAKKAKTLNIAQVLSGSGRFVHSPGSEGNKLLWELTDTGRKHVRGLLGLPEAEAEVEHDVGSLQAVAAKIKDPVAREFVNESIICLQAGAKRAAIVFLWAGTIRALHEKLLKKNKAKLTAAVQKHDTNAKAISKLDHFAYAKDTAVLKAAKDLTVLDKTEYETLDDGLKLRNRCGHPAKYSPGTQKVRSFVEDMIGVMF